VASSRESGIELRDGRRLVYCEYGTRDGSPVFFFHGWPGSRLDFAPNDAAAAAAGVRVIAVDRPGIGGSEPQPGRKVLDWPTDVAALADALTLGRFAVLGFSFGGPYARACAYALPERVTRAGLLSCLGPIDDPAAKRGMPPATRYGLAAARLSSLFARPMVAFTARQALGGKMIDQLAKSMAPPDTEVLKRKDVRDGLGKSLAESFRQGNGPATWDGVAVARGEGFRLEDIETEVLIWDGEQDRNDPIEMARAQERRLPHVRAVYYPDDGHLIFFTRMREILPPLAERAAE
jgi:pimeloyl-ACP methyl ester carboxylesterase